MSAIERAILALLAAMATASLLFLFWGASPVEVYGLLLARTWGDAYGFGQVLFKATPLALTGLAVSLAWRGGLLNVGGEGQLAAGSLAMGLVGAAMTGVPALVALPLALGAGMVAGGVVAAIPAVLKVRAGAHEVISTIMMNFVVVGCIGFIGRQGAYVEATVHTAPIAPSAAIPSLGIAGSAASWAVALAVCAAVALHVVLARSRVGFDVRALGAQAAAAEAGGVAVARTTAGLLLASGAMAGLVGASTVLGYKGYFEDGLGSGSGFMGIAVALLAGGRPLAVLPAALFFATLSHGALAISTLVPREIVDVVMGVVILAVGLSLAPRQGAAR